jgi:hypothetical protein
MWKAKRRGCLEANSKPMGVEELTILTGKESQEIAVLLEELKDWEVLSIFPDGTIYNRRMYRLAEKERQISEVRSEAGQKGGTKSQAKGKQNKQNQAKPVSKSQANIKQNSCSNQSKSQANIKQNHQAKWDPSSPSPSSFPTSKNKRIDHFEQIWNRYPHKTGKQKAVDNFLKTVKTDQDVADINKALDNYLELLRSEEWRKPQDGKTWFGNWQDWTDYKPPRTKEQQEADDEVEKLRKIR